MFIYWLFPELEPATYYIEMDPGLANAPGSSLASDVASADWVVLTGLWSGWLEPNASLDYGPDTPNQVIRDHFCEAGSYQDGLVAPLPPLPLTASAGDRRPLPRTRVSCICKFRRLVDVTLGRPVAGATAQPSGRRRQTGPGRWRKTVKTGRSVAGTQTVRFPLRSPAAVASATAAGVVANGAAFSPSRHRVCTKPGRTTSTLAPRAGERVAEPLGEAVEAGLGRAVHEVAPCAPARRRRWTARRARRAPGGGTARRRRAPTLTAPV